MCHFKKSPNGTHTLSISAALRVKNEAISDECPLFVHAKEQDRGSHFRCAQESNEIPFRFLKSGAYPKTRASTKFLQEFMRSSYANGVDVGPSPVTYRDWVYCLNFISGDPDLKCLCRDPQPLLVRIQPHPFPGRSGKERAGQTPLTLPTSCGTSHSSTTRVTGKLWAVGPRYIYPAAQHLLEIR